MIEELSSMVLDAAAVLEAGPATATLKRSHTLAGQSGISHALELAAAAGSGATALSLRFAGGGAISYGFAPAGIKLTIGGQEYALAAKATPAGGALAVTITPGLVAPAAESDAATFDPAAEFSFGPPATAPLVWQEARSDQAATVDGHVSGEVVVPKLGAPTTPEVGDLVDGGALYRGYVLAIPHTSGGVWALLWGSRK